MTASDPEAVNYTIPAHRWAAHLRPAVTARAARRGRGRSRRTSRGARRQAGIDEVGCHEGEGHVRFAPVAVIASVYVLLEERHQKASG